jgi:predicted nucleotidyltransferase component of viral defense system
MNEKYRAQIDLLVRILPEIARNGIFALKGGGAINMFERPLPRMSVDIDLCYPVISPRSEALSDIKSALDEICHSIRKRLPNVKIDEAKRAAHEYKIFCRTQQAEVKIEVNTTMRGHVFPLRTMQLHPYAQEVLGHFLEMSVVSREELFGGKICAAMDRQHPRDLFDIALLFREEGLSRAIILGFLVSLISHNRPMHELLSPNFSDMRKIFSGQFAGMAASPFTYDDYEETRARLIAEICRSLNEKDRIFLLSLKQGTPDWKLIDIPELRELPAVSWKLENIRKLKRCSPEKHLAQMELLQSALTQRSNLHNQV